LKREEKEKQERLVREELEKKRKYEEDLRNRTERGEKFEFTPEQLHEIVNNTPERQRLLQEKKQRREEETGGVPREDSRVAFLADRVDEDLVVVEASSVGGEERHRQAYSVPYLTQNRSNRLCVNILGSSSSYLQGQRFLCC
jgi:hypothetical protein